MQFLKFHVIKKKLFISKKVNIDLKTNDGQIKAIMYGSIIYEISYD